MIKPSSQNWKLLSYAGLCATAWPTVFLWNIWFLLALGTSILVNGKVQWIIRASQSFLTLEDWTSQHQPLAFWTTLGRAISCRSWGIRRSSCKGKKFSDRFRWAKESCAHFASRLSLGNLASGLLSTGKYSKCPGIRLQVNSWRAEREVAEVQRNVSQKWNTLQKKTLRTGGAGCRSISAARSLFWDLRHVQITAAPVVISAVTIWVFSTNGILKMVSNIHLQFPFIKGKFDICLGKPLCKSHPGDCNNFGV